MVTYTSTTLIDAQCAGADRYRVAPISIIKISPQTAGRLVAVDRRTDTPVFAAFMGEVCPEAGMSWHRGTNPTTVFGDKLAVDIQIRVGPPPPSRPSV
jgi:hypothetical protein